MAPYGGTEILKEDLRVKQDRSAPRSCSAPAGRIWSLAVSQAHPIKKENMTLVSLSTNELYNSILSPH